MKSIEGNFSNSKVDELLKKHFIELRSVSPADSCHVLDIDGLKVSSIKFWSLWDNDKLIGCGALKFLEEGHGELKSIRVAESFRNKGYGIKVIQHLILEAKKLNIILNGFDIDNEDFIGLHTTLTIAVQNYILNTKRFS